MAGVPRKHLVNFKILGDFDNTAFHILVMYLPIELVVQRILVLY